MMARHEQPCGCVVITDDGSVTINDVEMSHIVANVCGVEHCPIHQAEWDASMDKFVARMDAELFARIYA